MRALVRSACYSSNRKSPPYRCRMGTYKGREGEMENTSIDWVVPGAKVAVVMSGVGYTAPNIKVCEVQRLTATQVVLKGVTAKFRRGDLTQLGERNAWSPSSKIMKLDDPWVINMRLRQLVCSVPDRMKRLINFARTGNYASTTDLDDELGTMVEMMGKIVAKAEMIKKGQP